MYGGEYILDGGARGRKVGSKNKVQRKCGFDSETKRCNRKSKGNMNEWCTVGKKTKRCKKSSLGKQKSPKNPNNVARGRAQMNSLKQQGKWKGRPKKRTAADGPPPLPTHLLRKTRKPIKTVSSGLTCNTMSQKDCEGKGGNLMGCRWGKFGRAKKNTCGQKATASHIGKVKRPGAGRKKKSVSVESHDGLVAKIEARRRRKKSAKNQKAGGCPPALQKLCKNPNFNDPKCKQCVKPKKKCSKALKKLCKNPNFNDPTCNQCGGNQQGGSWSFIVNPETGRRVSITGTIGQKVLQNYVNML
jgi:hypothetical protein